MGKRVLQIIAGLLPHLLLTYSLMLLTFFVINVVNESMAFLTSKTSQHFEMVYTVTVLLTATAAFVRKHVRIPAAAAVVCAVALVIPVIRALILDTISALDFAAFSYIALANALVSLVFSVMLIVAQRKAAS